VIFGKYALVKKIVTCEINQESQDMCVNISQKFLNVRDVLKFGLNKKESGLQFQRGLQMSKGIKTSKSEGN